MINESEMEAFNSAIDEKGYSRIDIVPFEGDPILSGTEYTPSPITVRRDSTGKSKTYNRSKWIYFAIRDINGGFYE